MKNEDQIRTYVRWMTDDVIMDNSLGTVCDIKKPAASSGFLQTTRKG